MKSVFRFVLAVAILGMAACKKDNNNNSSAVTKENLTGTYKLTGATSQTGTAAPVDEFASLSACEKDDLVKLNADLTYNYVDAGTKCSPAGDDNGNWSLPSATQIILDGTTFNIKSFDGRLLVISISYSFGGTTSIYTQSLTRQ